MSVVVQCQFLLVGYLNNTKISGALWYHIVSYIKIHIVSYLIISKDLIVSYHITDLIISHYHIILYHGYFSYHLSSQLASILISSYLYYNLSQTNLSFTPTRITKLHFSYLLSHNLNSTESTKLIIITKYFRLSFAEESTEQREKNEVNNDVMGGPHVSCFIYYVNWRGLGGDFLINSSNLSFCTSFFESAIFRVFANFCELTVNMCL